MFYQSRGNIPRKRHVAFRQESGELFHEELIGSRGFSGASSLLYHLRPPTRVLDARLVKEFAMEPDPDPSLRMRHFQLAELPRELSPTVGRTLALFNADVAAWWSRPVQDDQGFYRNAGADEVVYVCEGQGVLESQMGETPFRSGDYLVIPRGIIHRYRLDSEETRLLIIESRGQVSPPNR
ncbi:MAG: cupin domain-containing protein, partial [Planctomycetales bacterium]